MEMLEQTILNYSCTTKNYVSFSNENGKKWVISKKHMKLNLCIYQPSSLKGKLVKLILPTLNSFKKYPSSLHVNECGCIVAQEISNLIENVFGCKELTYSFFLGTPGVHQKTVIQINSGNNILGYCKVTDSNAVYANFIKEMQILMQLRKNGCHNIPVGLCTQRIMKEEIGVYVQSTSKTVRSKTCHRLDERHITFISTLCKNSLHHMEPFESGIYRDIEFLKEIPDMQVEIGSIVSYVLRELENGSQQYCINHGDFTPWNTYIEGGQLNVFDWEYAETDYLPMLDIFHFFMQVCIFEKHMSSQRIIREFMRLRKNGLDNWVKWTGYSANTLYLCYLLSVIARTMMREKQLTETSRKSIEVWRHIVSGLQVED